MFEVNFFCLMQDHTPYLAVIKVHLHKHKNKDVEHSDYNTGGKITFVVRTFGVVFVLSSQSFSASICVCLLIFLIFQNSN